MDSFSKLASFVKFYNAKNPSFLMNIMDIKNKNDTTAIQFNLQLAYTPLFSLNQMEKDDDIE